MKNNIVNHYNKKYLSDSTILALEKIKKTKIPTTRFEAILKYFPDLFSGGAVLEIGAGDGRVAASLLQNLNSIDEYIACEFSGPRLDSLKKNIKDSRFSARELNVDEIPEEFYVKKYDSVIMVALIEHLLNPLKAMRNINKLLKPGGFVYIDTPNIAKYSNRLKLLRGKFPSTASTNEGLTTYEGKPVDLYDEGHLHYFTYRSLSKMLIDYCGYSSVKKLGYHIGNGVFGKKIHCKLSNIRPELFSELLLAAYK